MKNETLNKETIEALEELGTVLQGIHDRLHKEGFIIKDGKIYKPDQENCQKSPENL